MVSGTHTIPISLGILMEIVWEAHHNGGPMSLGVPETATEYTVDLPTQDAILTKKGL